VCHWPGLLLTGAVSYPHYARKVFAQFARLAGAVPDDIERC
jgi:hypothetical protein